MFGGGGAFQAFGQQKVGTNKSYHSTFRLYIFPNPTPISFRLSLFLL